MDLDKLRKKINSIDDEILRLLGERRQVARDVIRFKQDQDMPLRDADREQDLLARRIARGRELGLDAHLVTRVFHEIIDDSVRIQQLFLLDGLNREAARPQVIAFQGIEGAYSYLAAKKFFASIAESLTFTGYTAFREVAEAVERGVADFALLPVENTTAGNINDVYDILSRTRLSIVGEEIFRVEHCLLGIEERPITEIRRVLSHPQALAQCAGFLSRLPNCQAEYFADTAMAVRKVKEDSDPSKAAIASEEAGRLYGLKVLARDLADQVENFTRFLVIARQPIRLDSRIPSKTSVILATGHHPGALNRALDVFTNHGINMTKLDARPKAGSPFEYLFYIDFEGHRDEESVQAALAGLREVTSYLKILGSYPMENRGKTPPSIRALLAGTGPRGEDDERSDAGAADRDAPSTSAANAASTSGSFPGSRSTRTAGDDRFPLASRSARQAGTRIRVRDVEIGGDEFVVIAGPAAVESEEQIRRAAHQVKECGGKLLRGGCFLSRGTPGGFEGLGLEGLRLLAQVGREYDLPVVTEIIAPEDVPAVAQLADVLLVGARNMQNYSLLAEAAKLNRPIILKRGTLATVEEFLASAEFILELGNHQVILCERGIRTFETVTRTTLDLGAIPILKRETHLPVIVDPSHAAGQRDLVEPLALAARSAGPHGMMVDLHPDPEHALTEGEIALPFDDFARLLREVYRP